jgi:hypothetical protein
MRKPKPATGWRKALEAFSKGLMFLLKPLQIVSNFIFLSFAYFVGVGLSALFYRLGAGRRKTGVVPDSNPGIAQDPNEILPNSYWQPLPPAPRDLDAWLRPF